MCYQFVGVDSFISLYAYFNFLRKVPFANDPSDNRLSHVKCFSWDNDLLAIMAIFRITVIKLYFSFNITISGLGIRSPELTRSSTIRLLLLYCFAAFNEWLLSHVPGPALISIHQLAGRRKGEGKVHSFLLRT